MTSTAVSVQGSFAASSLSAADDVFTSAGFATLPACDGGGRWATGLWPSLFSLVAGGQTLFQGLHDIAHGSPRRFRRCGYRSSFQFGLHQGLEPRVTFIVKLMERIRRGRAVAYRRMGIETKPK